MSFFGGTEKIDVLTGGQKRLLNSLTDVLGQQLGQSGPVYGGTVTPGLNTMQTQAMAQGRGLESGRIDDSGAITSLLSGAGDPAAVQSYYRDAIVPAATQDFNDALRTIDARYGNTWGGSGAHQRGVSNAAARFGTGLGQILGGLVYNDRNAAQDRMATGVQANAIRNQDQRANIDALMGLGNVQRSYEGQQNQEALSKWEAGQAYNNPWFGLLGPALGTNAYGTGQQQGYGSAILGGLGGLLGGIGGFL